MKNIIDFLQEQEIKSKPWFDKDPIVTIDKEQLKYIRDLIWLFDHGKMSNTGSVYNPKMKIRYEKYDDDLWISDSETDHLIYDGKSKRKNYKLKEEM